MAMQVAIDDRRIITVAIPRRILKYLNHKTQLKLQTERGTFFFSFSLAETWGCNQGGFCFIFLFSCSRNYRVCVFFSSSDWLWIFKSFLNLLGVDRFFVLIFRFVLQFFLWFFSGFFITFFHFFHFWDCRICCDHLNVLGIFMFSILFFSFTFNLPLFFQVFFLLFQFLCQRR